jgi:uncharacterized protein YbjT (DUF2867 family)
MRVLVTRGGGVLGPGTIPLLDARGQQVHAPGPTEVDLFDRTVITLALNRAGAILHLATRIRARKRGRAPATSSIGMVERAAPNLARDPVRDRAGLAGPRAGQDRDRAP